MNRPKLDDYQSEKKKDFGYIFEYYKDLEKYCDELEKGLNEACEVLETYSKELHAIIDGVNSNSVGLKQILKLVPSTMWKTKEEWEETLLKDEL